MDLLFQDTETTGLDPVDCEIWEYAGIRVYQPGCVDEDVQVVHFQQETLFLDRAEPRGLEISRFHERRLPPDQLLTKGEACQRWLEVTAGSPQPIGAVPSFDTERIERQMRTFGLKPGWHYQMCDVETLAVGMLSVNNYGEEMSPLLTPPYDSDQLSRTLGVDPPLEGDRHTALGDAVWAAKLWYWIRTGEIPPWLNDVLTVAPLLNRDAK